ncbi:MAG: ATP-binding protein [Eubacteriales bacterium]|nr:ATP-binding protein [Eubacteriales bacterium]
MRLIPGKTKVKMELFKGVSLGDMLIGGFSVILLLFIMTSSLPGRLYIAIGVALVAVALLLRMDGESNYAYLLRIIRHFSYPRSFERVFSDKDLLRSREEGMEQVAFDHLFEEKQAAERAEETKDERKARLKQEKAEKKAQKKAEKAERKADDKLLKRKDVSEEEKDAIWRKRAEQSAEKKQQKSADKVAKQIANARDMAEIAAFTDIEDDFIVYGKDYFGAAIEIPPVEFRFMSGFRRQNAIENSFGQVLRALSADYAANIVKIERPVMYDTYLDNEYAKLEDLRASYEKGMLTEEELRSRVEILYDRINELRELCFGERVIQPFYYVVLFDSDRQQLTNAVRSALDTLRNGEMNPHRLNSKELAVFLRYSNEIDFDEREIDKILPGDYAKWAMPASVRMQARTTVVNGILTHNMRVVNYPGAVNDAWLATVMSIPATKVVVKCTPMDRGKAIQSIDRSLSELRDQFANTGVDSKRMELQDHIESLGDLLATLQGESENLLEVNVYVTAYDIHLTRDTSGLTQPPPSELANINNMKKMVRRTYQEQGFRLNNMEFDQVNAFIASQVSAWDPMRRLGRDIPTNTVAAMFPWVFAHVSDENGIKLGAESGVPVMIDFFRRDSERVNSNMVIVGKSGSGKSYATKSVLANLAADDAKIFILDPENEYAELAHNLHGKFINVGNAQQGRLNPFHIITSLEDDEADGSTASGSYATHLQFLEEFFRQIMPDCEKDAMEYLNSLVDRMYTDHGITAETDLGRLRPSDYPTFDDLYDTILTELQSTDSEYIRNMLRILTNHVAKFSTGGRNANIWNGPSTVTTDENFTVFNFQSLLANRNTTIANAQMLLVLKYIDNEIIKNRDYNTRYGLKRKIVVVIDEAHVFIDTKFPAALDFMYQLAKRIRKYNGMQIVITQNIKDFVGSEEIARKSTAIINACQYSFIFSLAPNDMSDLCTLYEKAGGINEMEQEQIVTAPRGQAFTVMSPQSRSTFKVEVTEDVREMFRESNYVSSYFSGEDGARAWEDFMGDSREKRAVLKSVAEIVEEVAEEEKASHVSFEEITEEELVAAQAGAASRKSRPVKAVLPEAEDDFPEIPEIPDDPEAFLAMQKTASVPNPAPIPPVVPQVVVQAPATSTRTEELLGELLGKFSYESMMQEIRRSVKEELGREAAAAVPVEPAAPAEPVAPVEQPEESAGEESTSLGSIFNADAVAEAQRLAAEEAEPVAEEEPEGSGFDIMALLMAEAQNMSNISPIEMMVDYNESVIPITLEELAIYNQRHSA